MPGNVESRRERVRTLASGRAIGLFILYTIMALSSIGSLGAAQQVALVIGNEGYHHATRLNNPHNDARAVAAALERLGFSVMRLEDSSKAELERTLAVFRQKSRGSEVALLYYAGHAIQVEGRNYLVPVDGQVSELGDVGLQLLALNTALQQLHGEVNVVILDACRDNPFAEALSRSAASLGRSLGATRGLRREEAQLAGGTYLMMAAAPDRVAMDGPAGGHSPYTEALLRHVETPGLDLRFLHARVREEVVTATAGGQSPEAIDRLPAREIFLAGGSLRIDRTQSDAEPALLSITTRPTGARVFVDGAYLGDAPQDFALNETTPRRVDVEVHLQDHETYREAIWLRPGQESRLDVLLSQPEREPPPSIPAESDPARLYMEAIPAGARVRIMNIGPIYHHGIELEPGAYDIEVTAPGHRAHRRWYRLAAGERRIKVELTAGVDVPSIVAKAAASESGPAPVPVRKVQRVERVSQNPGQVFRDCPHCPEMVVVPAGNFRMGSPETEVARDSDEGPLLRVDISRPFALGRTEVTQGQWRAVMGRNPARFKACGDECPVENVSWTDAQRFVQRLSEETGHTYRLPSEAEWEYAARAGSVTPWPWGVDAADACIHANVADRDLGRQDRRLHVHECVDGFTTTASAGRFRPNAFGLFDMVGNVAEWVEDCWSPSLAGVPVDGSARTGACDRRAVRGGSWLTGPAASRVAFRAHESPTVLSRTIGLRVASDLEYR